MTDSSRPKVEHGTASRALLEQEEQVQLEDHLSSMAALESKTADGDKLAGSAASSSGSARPKRSETDLRKQREAMLRALRSDSVDSEESGALVEGELEHIVLVDPFTGEHLDMNVFYERKIAPWLGGCLPVIEDFLLLLFFLALGLGKCGSVGWVGTVVDAATKQELTA